MVAIKNLIVRIKNQLILNNVSATLLPGRITCFIGKSGAGKTTLLKAIANLVPISSGGIVLGTTEQKIGFVFQDFNLFTNLTVLENCIDPMLVAGIEYAQAKEQALEQLQRLGMTDFVNKYPSELSGGQQQRVAIARSLCLKPQILLLDEPTASLDPVNTDTLIAIIKSLAAQGLTIGFSSQDMNFVKKIFDRAYYFENGKIIEFCDGANNIDAFPIMKKFVKK